MSSERTYLLTNKQYFRRFLFLGLIGTGGLIGTEIVKNYIHERTYRFKIEQNQLKSNPNFFHTLHEQVALNFEAKD